MERDERLAECKKRTLKYLDIGNVREAFASMLSELGKHPETAKHTGGTIAAQFALLPDWINDPIELKRWIEGFN